jgi:hypothetical protein
MGGVGSGNFRPHKRTVESCLMIDIVPLVRLRVVQTGVRHEGTLSWPTSAAGEPHAALRYVMDTKAGQWMRLTYQCQTHDGEAPEAVDYWLQLVTTPLHYGGSRWWFACPLVVNETACARRVRKLYLPPGEKYFGCWHCYGLTYQSRRDRWATSTRAWPAVTVQHTDVAEERILRAGRRFTETRQESTKKAERTT